MKFLKNLVNKVSDAVAGARAITTQFTETNYLDAAISVGFLVGGADGDFDADERAAMIQLIKSDPTLAAFDDDQISASFDKINKLYAITLPMGNRKAMEVVGQITDPTQKKALMETGAVLATIDGSIDDCELDAIRNIGSAIGESIDDYKDLLVL